MKPIVFLNSHPIQYFAPLYQEISGTPDLELTVWYCSDESIKGKLDKGFGENVKWDIPLLKGYEYKFIKNNSWSPSIHKGFWGLQNWAVIRLLYKQPKSIIVIHGWAYLTNVLALIFGKIYGHTICLRAETPWNQEQQKGKFKTKLKHLYLKILFLFIDKFLFIGKQNRLFYKALGVKDSKLIFTPYAVDNKRFHDLSLEISQSGAREKLRLPLSKKIILFSGKFIKKKRPLDLLKAFSKIKSRNALLVFVGDGELRIKMEKYIAFNALSQSVTLTGFINQTEIPLYYKAADLFVMCSGIGETWGLSVNEAMNFGLPIIISDDCGSAYDLVESDVNGDIFETGNIDKLTLLLDKYLNITEEKISEIKNASYSKIKDYSYKEIIERLRKIE